VSEPTVWCPSCGAEYVAGTTRCAECRVALVGEPPGDEVELEESPPLVEMGTWPLVQAMLLRRRLEDAGISVFLDRRRGAGTLFVGDEQADFADAVIREIDVDDESPMTTEDVLDQLDERLAQAAGLLEELRLRVELGTAETD